MPYNLRTVLHDIIIEKLWYQKFFAHWLLKIFTDKHKQNRCFCSSFYQTFWGTKWRVLDSIVTDDEICVSHTKSRNQMTVDTVVTHPFTICEKVQNFMATAKNHSHNFLGQKGAAFSHIYGMRYNIIPVPVKLSRNLVMPYTTGGVECWQKVCVFHMHVPTK